MTNKHLTTITTTQTKPSKQHIAKDITICIQLNINRCRVAQDLLQKTASELRANIVMGQEPNKQKTEEYNSDIEKDTCIWINGNVTATKYAKNKGFNYVETEREIYISCYFSPNKTAEDFEKYLYELSKIIKRSKKDIIIGGDLNAKSITFGSTDTNRRGQMLEEFVNSHNLIPINTGNEPTFTNKNGSSRIDITMATEKIARGIKNWTVRSDIESLSPHKVIYFEIHKNRNNDKRQAQAQQKKWKINTTNKCKMEKQIKGICPKKLEQCCNNATELTKILKDTCNSSIGHTKNTNGNTNHRNVYWWNQEVAEQRRICIAQRRTLTRGLKKNTTEEIKNKLIDDYKTERNKLKKIINTSKAKAWENLIKEADDNVWGSAYKIITGKLKGKPYIRMEEDEVKAQISKLFPKKAINKTNIPRKNIKEEELFTTNDVMEVAASIKDKKAPGPSGIPPEVMKTFATHYPEVIQNIANKYLKEGYFPSQWKKANLILIEKPNKGAVKEKEYRPICLLDVEGKMLEGLIKKKLEQELEENGKLYEHQYGFRKKRSTINALDRVNELIEKIRTVSHTNRKQCIMVTIDIKNAFNSARWDYIIKELKKKKISLHLIKIINSYLSDRYIISPNGRHYKTYCGVPQGSVLGPILWNVFYDQLVAMDTEQGVNIIAYADDVAIIVEGKGEEDIGWKIRTTLRQIEDKLDSMDLQIARHKTEMVALVGHRTIKNIHIKVNETEITLAKNLKYMGVHFDTNGRMTEHVKKIRDKTLAMATQLSRMLPNIKGPNTQKRAMLGNVIKSTMLYGSNVWSKAMEYKKYESMLDGVNRRMAIRISCAYRTVETLSVLTIAGIAPIKLLVEERNNIYKKMNKSIAEEIMTEKWQNMWNSHSSWTKTFIKDIKGWKGRKFGRLNFHMTQMLTGHGVFGTYLKKIGKSETDNCWYCGAPDSPKHTLLDCTEWEDLRRSAEANIGKKLTLCNIAETLLESEETWNLIKQLITNIMLKKESYEREKEG